MSEARANYLAKIATENIIKSLAEKNYSRAFTVATTMTVDGDMLLQAALRDDDALAWYGSMSIPLEPTHGVELVRNNSPAAAKELFAGAGATARVAGLVAAVYLGHDDIAQHIISLAPSRNVKNMREVTACVAMGTRVTDYPNEMAEHSFVVSWPVILRENRVVMVAAPKKTVDSVLSYLADHIPSSPRC